eukprot:SAG31_NODE_1421_length_8423_cov_2.477054_4_plen_182_part_00
MCRRRSVVQFVDLLDQTEHIAAMQSEQGMGVDDALLLMGWTKHCRAALKSLHELLDKLDAVWQRPGGYKEGQDVDVDAHVDGTLSNIATHRTTITQFLQKCGSLGEEYRVAIVHFLNPMNDHHASAAIFIQSRWRGYLGRKYMDHVEMRNLLVGFYSEHNPEELTNIDLDALLKQYAGREL